ncbi:hypothetical protein YC2023_084802 [Brassica napus]
MISSQIGSDLHSCPRGACGLGFELSPSSTEFFNSSIDQENDFYNAYNYNTSHKSHEVVGGGGAIVESETKVSASPSSSEHHHGEDSGKSLMKREADDGGKDIGQRSQKVSYYRCTTQKCNVKKRVERSYQDPTVVITTYESQHNHPIPTSRRTAMFSGPAACSYNSSSLSPVSDFIINTPRTFSHDGLFRVPYASMNVNANYEQQQSQEFHHESDYELLKEMFPSVFLKQEP